MVLVFHGCNSNTATSVNSKEFAFTMPCDPKMCVAFPVTDKSIKTDPFYLPEGGNTLYCTPPADLVKNYRYKRQKIIFHNLIIAG